jgi:uncharacterized protein (TIGR02271 family)
MSRSQYSPDQPEITAACVAGLFHKQSDAEDAMEELKAAGFAQSEIGIATSHEGGYKEGFWDKVTSLFGKYEHTESATELEDSLLACGLPEDQARYFNRSIGQGDVLVTVHATGRRAEDARNIFQQAGADIATDAAKVAQTLPFAAGERRIQLLGEVLRVHKERVQRGEVRLRKEVVTEQQNIEVPVSREELVVERVPGEGREATGQVGAGEKEIRVPLSEERVQVEKKPVVKEEVRVGKRQVEDTKRVSETIRHEELRGEEEGEVEDEALRDIRQKPKRTA